MSAERPMVIGHRGASSSAPENTIAAFRAAIDQGADGVELDVQLSCDGVPVVYHDRSLRRTTGRRRRLVSLDAAKLAALDCGSWFDARFRDERIPTLSEVLEVVRDLSLINLELKSSFDSRGRGDALARSVVDAVRAARLERSVLLSSFDHRHLATALRIAPEIARGVLVHPVDFGPASRAAVAVRASTVVLARRQLGPQRVAEARSKGLRVLVYTVDARRDIARCLHMDVDGIITNDPSATRMILRELRAG